MDRSKAEIARRLGCKIDTLNSYLGKMNIEYKGKKTDPKRKSAEELANSETYVSSHRLRLIDEGS